MKIPLPKTCTHYSAVLVIHLFPFIYFLFINLFQFQTDQISSKLNVRSRPRREMAVKRQHRLSKLWTGFGERVRRELESSSKYRDFLYRHRPQSRRGPQVPFNPIGSYFHYDWNGRPPRSFSCSDSSVLAAGWTVHRINSSQRSNERIRDEISTVLQATFGLTGGQWGAAALLLSNQNVTRKRFWKAGQWTVTGVFQGVCCSLSRFHVNLTRGWGRSWGRIPSLWCSGSGAVGKLISGVSLVREVEEGEVEIRGKKRE